MNQQNCFPDFTLKLLTLLIQKKKKKKKKVHHRRRRNDISLLNSVPYFLGKRQ